MAQFKLLQGMTFNVHLLLSCV